MTMIILVSFADYRYRKSLERLERQTAGFPFDERYFLTERTALTKKYWRRLKPWLYRRGFGFWSWKASIVKEFLGRLDDGDMLFWSDAGLAWNCNERSLKRFEEYIGMLSDDKDLLVFEQPTIEQEWTKGDVLEALGAYDDEAVCCSLQLWAGCFLIKKTPRMIAFLDRWIALNDLSRELITDKRSTKPNKPGFKEHRHDQSIFSVLAKQFPHVVIPWQEVQPEDGDWSKIEGSPVVGRRLKEIDRPKSEVFKNKLMRPWRSLLHFYFKYIRNYDYRGKYVW